MFKKFLFMAVVAMVALCSCSKDDDVNVDSVVAWENELSMGKLNSGVTGIVIETGVNISSYKSDDTHKPLNAAGTLWEVLDGKVLKIQTSGSKILGRDSFIHNGMKIGLFADYYNAETISGLENLDMSKVTVMSGLFTNCKELTSVNLSSFDTSHTKDMGGMFLNCFKLRSITGLDKLDTKNVTIMEFMFANCTTLTELNLSSFNTSNVTDMFYMFAGSNALTELDLSSFDTGNVIYMAHMFEKCNKLGALTFGKSFSMAKVNTKENMFTDCGSAAHCYVRGITDPVVKDALREGTEWNEAYMEFQ